MEHAATPSKFTWPDAEAMRLMTRLLLLAVAALTIIVASAAYESSVLDTSPFGEAPPIFSDYYLLRSLGAALFSGLIAWTIYRFRSAGCSIDREELSAGGATVAAVSVLLGIAFTALFVADVTRFDALAQEDSIVEWATTLLILGGSGLLLWALVRGGGGKIMGLIGLLLALLLFVIAMEEISWMQRVIGFATPAELAQVNWQGEFNLHNVQTDLSENVFYVGTALFLIVLPFLRDATPWLARIGPASHFVPGRWVAAASAPISIFNYGMWNVIPMQMTMMLTVFVMAFYAKAAANRGQRGESTLFALIAVAVVAGQAMFLLYGHTQPNIWDASEFKELFIGIGLFCFAADAAARMRKHQPTRRTAAPLEAQASAE